MIAPDNRLRIIEGQDGGQEAFESLIREHQRMIPGGGVQTRAWESGRAISGNNISRAKGIGPVKAAKGGAWITKLVISRDPVILTI